MTEFVVQLAILADDQVTASEEILRVCDLSTFSIEMLSIDKVDEPECTNPDHAGWPERVIEDPRPHYAVMVANMPPTEIVCKCGAVVFTSGTLSSRSLGGR